MFTLAALTLTIAISALFGCLQIAAAIFLLRRLALGWRWRERPITLGALAGLWLLTSGAGEVIVAVGEALRGASKVMALRGAVDVTLLIVTLVLLVAMGGYLALVRALPSPK